MESDKKGFKAFIYKWIPIIFGCHQRSDRSFFYHGKQFPICARCTGELVGIIVAVISGFFFRLPLLLSLVILIPMLIDGLIQLLTSYESNNIKRFITGFLFGYGLGMLFVLVTAEAFKYGIRLGEAYRNNI